MPTFQIDTLRQYGYELFEAVGCSVEDTQAVVDHLIESDLFGHHSHGALRFYEYAQAIREGRFQPRAVPEVVIDNPCAAVVDANGALGQAGATFAMNLAIEKARQHGTGTVTLRNTSHVGRVGAYPLLADDIGIAFVNAGTSGIKLLLLAV